MQTNLNHFVMNKGRSALMCLFIPVLAFVSLAADAEPVDDSTNAEVILDDFESDTPGKWPSRWRFLASRDREFRPLGSIMNENEKFYVVAERGNKFVRGYTKGEAQRISLPSSSLQWSLSHYPVLSWDWRALQLPEGASEDTLNDVGGAVYVSFSRTDWLGRPLSIKYTYSSSLPVGTTISTGNVKIIVASSGADGKGRWIGIERDVVADYRRVFGGEPPDEPYTITLWSDSDDTRSIGEVDFDNFKLKRGRN